MRIRKNRLPIAIAVAFSIVAATAASAQDLPRYQLQVGQQLVYHCDRTDRHSDDGTWSQRHTDWKVNVLSQNNDGSWHIAAVLDTGGTVHEKDGSSIPYERLLEACACDLYPDGAIAGNDDQIVALSRLFPRLPADVAQLHSGWDDQTDDHARMLHFALDADQTPGHLTFTSAVTGGVAGVFEPGSRSTYHFNPQTGIVDEIHLQSHTPGAAYTEEGKISLTASRRLDAPLLSRIAALASDNDSALAAYQKAIASNAPTPAVTAAQTKLKQVAEAFLTAMLMDGAAGDDSIQGAAIAMIPDPPSNKDILNAPAPDWTLKDLQGREHSLKDFRGKVLLLDFGSRGCPWCIREIPQLVRLSKDFQDQPVAIIDMDLDANIADAQFVMDALHMPYLMLLAPDQYNKYPVEGTPTVVIVDQAGIMRRRFIGYDNSGYCDMKAAIQSLLASPKQSQGQ